jgi:hypothetical protein
MLKVEVVPVLNSLRSMGEWRYNSTILALSCTWRCVVSFTPQLLYPMGKCLWYPLDKRLGEPQTGLDDVCRYAKLSEPQIKYFDLTSITQERNVLQKLD